MTEPRRIDQTTADMPQVSPESLQARKFVRDITTTLCAQETPIKFATGDHLQAVVNILENSPELLDETFDDPEIAREALDLLKRRIGDTDGVTKLERRDKQTDRIREAMKKMAETDGDFDQKAKHMGFISFDVRGLKMVNDLMKDHKYGDEYLRKVTQITQEHILPFIQTLVGKEAQVNLARDGGDEFSILIANAQVDLTSPAQSFTSETDNTTKSLMQRINDFINFRMAQEVNDIIPREKLESYMGEDMPPGFELKFFVASGAATLFDVVANPKNEHFKKDLARAEDGHLPKEGKAIINTLLSSLRTSADEQSYEVKSLQNQHWINSDRPEDQAMIRVISRNDVTVTLAKKAQSERQRANTLEGQLHATHASLEVCLTEKAKLEAST